MTYRGIGTWTFVNIRLFYTTRIFLWLSSAESPQACSERDEWNHWLGNNMILNMYLWNTGLGIFNIYCKWALKQKPHYHDDVIKRKHFPRCWPLVRGIHQPGDFPAQRPVTWSFDVFFYLRLNKRLSEAGDLRRHRGHYDVNVMTSMLISLHWFWQWLDAVRQHATDLIFTQLHGTTRPQWVHVKWDKPIVTGWESRVLS